jgi:hypothetical protein
MSIKKLEHTTNKSDRNINKQFDLKNFNQKFEENDLNIKNKQIKSILPHTKPIEIILSDMYSLFIKILKLIFNLINPIPYIFSTNDNIFTFSLLLIFSSIVIYMFSL